MRRGSINPQYISLPKTLRWHPWAIKTLKRKKYPTMLLSEVRQRLEEVHTATHFEFPAQRRKKRKEKRKASWVVGGSSSLFLAYSKEHRHVRKKTRSPLRNHIGSHQFSVSESLDAHWHTHSHTNSAGPLAAAASSSSLVLLLTEDAAEPIAESCNTL